MATVKAPQDRKKKAGPKPTQASDVSEWKKGFQGALLELPSGKAMMLRPASLQSFVSAGKVPNSLLPLMRGALEGKSKEMDMSSITEEQAVDMMKMFDVVMATCAMEPRVYQVPEDEDDRLNDRLYTDEVEEQDKAFVFQWAVGGTSDVQKFRDELGERMVAVSKGK